VLSGVGKLQVFPNPAIDVLNVRLSAIDNDQMLFIYNIAGQLIYEYNGSIDSGENRLEINVSSFSSGMYLLTTGTQTKRETIKFMKL